MTRGKNAAASQRRYDQHAEGQLGMLRAELAEERRGRLTAERAASIVPGLLTRLTELTAQVDAGSSAQLEATRRDLSDLRSSRDADMLALAQTLRLGIDRADDEFGEGAGGRWPPAEYEILRRLLGPHAFLWFTAGGVDDSRRTRRRVAKNVTRNLTD